MEEAEAPSPDQAVRRRSGLGAVVTLGAVIGILEVVIATSFTALVFPGTLAVHLPKAIGLSLSAAAIILIWVALRATLPGTVASLQDTTAAILGVVAVAVAAGAPAAAHGTFLTVVLAVVVASGLTGLVFVALGASRLGNLIRFMPYPVVGGFMAGTGWLIFTGGMGVATGEAFTLANIEAYLRPSVAAKWVPAVVFGGALLLAMRRWRQVLLLPGAVVLAGAVFFVLLPVLGTSIPRAEADGWLLGPFPDAGIWHPWAIEALTGGDWGAVAAQAGTIATMVLVAVIALLLNASGIEVAAGRDIDLNRELRSAGEGNLGLSLVGGIPGFQALSITVLALRSGVPRRGVGIVAGGVCVVAMLFGTSLVSSFPRPVLGGLLLFLGLAFLYEWLVEAWRRLPWAEYLIIAAILLVVGAFGFLQGVALGLVLAVALFVVSYSREGAVKHGLGGHAVRSNVDRGPAQTRALRERGREIHILELQGFVFFGTASGLVERVQARLEAPGEPPLRFLVLDFRRVTGVDSSAVLGFEKVRRLLDASGAGLVVTSVPRRVARVLESGEVLDDGAVLPDLDRGLEWCEGHLLAEEGLTDDGVAASLGELLSLPDPRSGERLGGYLERLEIGPGEVVIRQGDEARDLFFLESGRLAVVLRRDDGADVRLRSMGPGTIVGELTMYLGTRRTASVVAEERSVFLRLSEESIARMQERDPELAAVLHRRLAALLAQRLADTSETIRALRD